jgi:OOP family OmpA-OmpF porin
LLAGCAGSNLPNNASVASDSTGDARAAEVQVLPGSPHPQDNPAAEISGEVLPADPAKTIFFSPGASTISSSERGKLKPLAARLKADRRLAVTLIGHANDTGSRSFNVAIADARIAATVAALKKMGVAAYQFRKRIVGDEKVPANCRSAECRRSMRRVDLVFSDQVDGS